MDDKELEKIREVMEGGKDDPYEGKLEKMPVKRPK